MLLTCASNLLADLNMQEVFNSCITDQVFTSNSNLNVLSLV